MIINNVCKYKTKNKNIKDMAGIPKNITLNVTITLEDVRKNIAYLQQWEQYLLSQINPVESQITRLIIKATNPVDHLELLEQFVADHCTLMPDHYVGATELAIAFNQNTV